MMLHARPFALPASQLRQRIGLQRVLSAVVARSHRQPLDSRLSLLSTCEEATDHLAACLAEHLRAGDCYCLFGEVGAGKSAFSRAFVRAACGDPYLPVPSPTFLLQNVYDETPGDGSPPVHHFDLYRLQGAAGTARLDLGHSFTAAVSLVEWADRLMVEQQGVGVEQGVGEGGQEGAAGHLPGARLDVHMTVLRQEEQARMAERLGGRLQQIALAPAAGGAAQAQGGEQHDAESDEDGECSYDDVRWRRIDLVPHGSEWQRRVGALRDGKGAGNDALRAGLLLLLDEQGEVETAAAATAQRLGTGGCGAG